MENVSLMFLPLSDLYELLDECENINELNEIEEAINKRKIIFHRRVKLAQ